ncbi:MAG: hypothetical protein OXE50_14810, partial [Chloroflexi bacterium]|nr:hypothetical protein [Chloroflexota bacterium]
HDAPGGRADDRTFTARVPAEPETRARRHRLMPIRRMHAGPGLSSGSSAFGKTAPWPATVAVPARLA